MLSDSLTNRLQTFDSTTRVVAITGAGISTESGIPDFRGPQGYWTVGSAHYQPSEMATAAMFQRAPHDVLGWYLYRYTVCEAAEPNASHHALAALEQAMGDRFTLVTQNVDGLHHRAGSSEARTFCVHGNIRQVRCSRPCSKALYPMPQSPLQPGEKRALTDEELEPLRCPRCGARLRPHVLWFDEYYDEELFRFDSTVHASQRADILVTVGSTGQTNLPRQAAALAARAGALIIDINLTDNPFARLATQSGGTAIRGKASEAVPPLCEALASALQ